MRHIPPIFIGNQNGQGQGSEVQTNLTDVDAKADEHRDQGIGDGVLNGVEGCLDVGQQQTVIVIGSDLCICTEQRIDCQSEEGNEYGQQNAEVNTVGNAVFLIGDGEAEQHIGQRHNDGAHQNGGTALAPGGLQILDEGRHRHFHQAVHQGGNGLHNAEQTDCHDGFAGEGPMLQIRAKTCSLQCIHQIHADDGTQHARTEGSKGKQGNLLSG